MQCSGITFPKPMISTKQPLPTSSFSPLFNTHFPNPSISTRKSFGSVKTRAAINDELVAEASMLSFYDLLGISETGTSLEIKQAYKQMARKYHPDVSPPDRVKEYTKRFIRVQEAYETLSDPGRRAMYDNDMARGLHLAFSARKQYHNVEIMEERHEWKIRWQSQLAGLKRRSMYGEDSSEDMSWGARMRRQRDQSSP